MKKFRILIVFAVGLSQAAGEMGSQSPPPKRISPPAIDLNLTLDIADEPDDQHAPRSAANASGSHSWIYWAMGATFAAGGIGWYLKEHPGKGAEVTRSEQVFTDER